jgi:hypothetical protein
MIARAIQNSIITICTAAFLGYCVFSMSSCQVQEDRLSYCYHHDGECVK